MEYLNIAGILIFTLFFFGFCIFIHELGHFLAAKWRGLHVIAFSIGFKKIWGFKWKGVEYRIGWIPFGGYVDLPQIDSSGDAKDENGNVLPKAKPFDRMITAFAGPFFNILFGFALGAVIWFCGIPQDTPRMHSITVGSIEENSPEYRAGLRKDDKIIKINGQSFYTTWNGFVQDILFSVGNVKLCVERDGAKKEFSYKPEENRAVMPKEGIAYPFFTPRIPLIVYPVEGSSAAKAGLKKDDLIVGVNGQDVLNFDDYMKLFDLPSAPGSVSIDVMRDGKRLTLSGIQPKVYEQDPGVYRIGITFGREFPISIVDVAKDSPAAKAGLKIGDILLSADGRELNADGLLQEVVAGSKGAPVSLKVKRGDKVFDASMSPLLYRFYDVGIQFVFVNHPTPWEQFSSVITMSYKTLRGVFSHESTLKTRHLSGPVGILRAIYISVNRGSWVYGLNLVVMITFSLGILNLLPIPVLDGGHIAIAFIEIVIRRPVPSILIQPLIYTFVTLLIGFMLFVTYFDVLRVYYDNFGSADQKTSAGLKAALKKPPASTPSAAKDEKKP